MGIDQLEQGLPARSFITNFAERKRYSRDITGRFSGVPQAVARPKNVEEVSQFLDACSRARVGVVPRGGNTGLVGGAIAVAGEIVVTLERMNGITELDSASRTILVEGGVTLGAVRAHAQAKGFDFPIDFAARASATIGGMIATDAGGALALRYGSMRDLVVALQVALADGTVIDRLDRPHKDSSGFDLTRLICGSEGTLGIVTAARLKLIPQASHRIAAILAMDSLEDAVIVAALLARESTSLEAADFFLQSGLSIVTKHTNLPPLFGEEHSAFLVTLHAGDMDPSEELADVLRSCARVRDAVVAQSSQRIHALWRYREMHNDAVHAMGVPHKFDIAVPVELVPRLVDAINAWLTAERPDAVAIYFGHLIDGNVHVNVLGAEVDDDVMEEAVFRLVVDMNGTIAAEHGVGQAKNKWLHLARSEREIEAMYAVKRSLDREGIMNPGKLFPNTR